MKPSQTEGVLANAQDAHNTMLKQLKGGETNMINTKATTNMEGYIEQFDAIKGRVGDEQVAAVILEQIAKDRRTERIAETRNGNRPNGKTNSHRAESNGSEPASQKQREYLKDLGVTVPKVLTKYEASKLIDKATSE